MAFKRSLEAKQNDFGVTSAEGYWRVDSMQFDFSRGMVNVVFAGYLSEAARLEGKAAIASYSYGFAGEDFANFLGRPATALFGAIEPKKKGGGVLVGDMLRGMAYKLAKSTKDRRDEDGLPLSFFENAEDV